MSWRAIWESESATGADTDVMTSGRRPTAPTGDADRPSVESRKPRRWAAAATDPAGTACATRTRTHRHLSGCVDGSCCSLLVCCERGWHLKEGADLTPSLGQRVTGPGQSCLLDLAASRTSCALARLYIYCPGGPHQCRTRPSRTLFGLCYVRSSTNFD